MTRVVVNGTFDLLHLGHLELLKYAKTFVDSYVLVLIDSDARVKSLKGHDRPIDNQEHRYKLLSALKYVDQVEIFNSDAELIELIKKFDPDIMVKGSDYKDQPIIGSQYCKEIIFYERYRDFSTTNKIQNIINRR